MENGGFWNGMTMQRPIHKNYGPESLTCVFANYLLKYFSDKKRVKSLRPKINKQTKSTQKG